MDVVILIGRILFAAVFLGGAVGHLTQTEAMSGYAHARGVPWARQMEMVQFQKDLALAGAALMVFALFSTGDVGLSVTGPLLDLG